MSSSLPSPLKICLKLAQSFKDCCGRRRLRADRSLRKTAKKKNNHPSLSPSPLWQSNTSRRGVDTAVPAHKGFGQCSMCYRGRWCSKTRSGRRNPCSIGPASVNICPEFAQRQLGGWRGRFHVPMCARPGDPGQAQGLCISSKSSRTLSPARQDGCWRRHERETRGDPKTPSSLAPPKPSCPP